ncbi:anti-sigma-K factor RskA [Rhizobium sp. PP-F2F-G48]|nr:anti-sigma-K factor RskA [Rhizobium sp. PP-F2F-G48]
MAAVLGEHIDIMTTENAKSGDSRLDQVIAGEYVLGVLSPEDRQKVEARMALDRNFAAMVDHWRSNMLTVDQTPRPTRRAPRRASPFAEPVAARPRPQRERVPVFNVAIWNSAAFWRGVACIATIGLIATGVSQAGMFATSPPRGLTTSLPLATGSDLALTARYDNDSGRLRLAPVAAAATAAGVADAKSIEIWLTPEGSAPVSLGVFATNSNGEIVVPKAVRTRLREGAPITVSLEPAGGSPTGAPTGKVLATGISGR